MAPDLIAAHPEAALNSVVTTVADATHALHQVELGVAARCADQGRPVAAQMLLATVVVRYPGRGHMGPGTRATRQRDRQLSRPCDRVRA